MKRLYCIMFQLCVVWHMKIVKIYKVKMNKSEQRYAQHAFCRTITKRLYKSMLPKCYCRWNIMRKTLDIAPCPVVLSLQPSNQSCLLALTSLSWVPSTSAASLSCFFLRLLYDQIQIWYQSLNPLQPVDQIF